MSTREKMSFSTFFRVSSGRYRRDFLSKQFALRESLYSDFINEAARLQIESLDHQMEKVGALFRAYQTWNARLILGTSNLRES
jgi:hypothetical protein